MLSCAVNEPQKASPATAEPIPTVPDVEARLQAIGNEEDEPTRYGLLSSLLAELLLHQEALSLIHI